MVILIIYLLIALTISFLCSLFEAVLLTTTHAQILLLSGQGQKSGILMGKLKEEIDRPLAAILSLNTIAHTVGAAGVGAQALKLFGSGYVAATSAILTVLILLLSEILPKTLGAVYAKQLLGTAAWGINVLVYITWPIVWACQKFAGLFTPKGHQAKITREEVTVTAEMGLAEGQLNQREQNIIKNILKLGDIPVREIMTPRSVLFALPENATAMDVQRTHDTIRHSRIPLFKENIDDIHSYVKRWEVRRLSAGDKGVTQLKEIAVPIKAIPESKDVADILDEMIAERIHIMLVVDEYGGTAGIVTLEDVIETLLGEEIVDELDNVDDMQEYARSKFKARRHMAEAAHDSFLKEEPENAD